MFSSVQTFKLYVFSFAVTSVMLEPFLEGQTLEDALTAKRVFIVDLEILSRLKLDEPRKVSSVGNGDLFKRFKINWTLIMLATRSAKQRGIRNLEKVSSLFFERLFLQHQNA